MKVSKFLIIFLFFQSSNSVQIEKKNSGYRGLTANGGTGMVEGHHRGRRALVFPDPSTLLLIFGLGTPLQLDRESVIVGLFTKMQYNLPSNSTDFTLPGVQYTRASKSRWDIYKIFQQMAELYGFGGKACLLRAICEAAYTPFDVENSLLGQLLQAFFRPSTSEEKYDEHADQEYRAAEAFGDQMPGENCHALYPECRKSVLDVFSIVHT